MSTVQEVEEAIRKLSPEDRAAFREWYAKFDAEEWDRRLEADVAAGQLDWLVQESRDDRQSGRCSDR